jgi:hypothetical protein
MTPRAGSDILRAGLCCREADLAVFMRNLTKFFISSRKKLVSVGARVYFIATLLNVPGLSLLHFI